MDGLVLFTTVEVLAADRAIEWFGDHGVPVFVRPSVFSHNRTELCPDREHMDQAFTLCESILWPMLWRL